MEVQDADLSRVDDAANRVEGSSIVSLLVFSVFDELARQDVCLKLRPCDEVVILAVYLPLFP